MFQALSWPFRDMPEWEFEVRAPMMALLRVAKNRRVLIELAIVMVWLFCPILLSPRVETSVSWISGNVVWTLEVAIWTLIKIGLLCLVINGSGTPLKDVGFVSYPARKTIAIVALVVVSTLLCEMLTFKFWSIPTVRLRHLAGFDVIRLVGATILAVAVATWDELAFRGYLITRLAGLIKNDEYAVVVSAVLYAYYPASIGIYALAPPTYGFPLFVCGIVFGIITGIVFIRTKSLPPLIAGHAALLLLMVYATFPFIPSQ